MLAYGIAGHHAGLTTAATSVNASALEERTQEGCRCWSISGSRKSSCRNACNCPHHRARERVAFQQAFLARMLFSCLVDTDFLDTEAFAASTTPIAALWPAANLDRVRALDDYLAGFRADSSVNRIRADISRPCTPAGRMSTGAVFTNGADQRQARWLRWPSRWTMPSVTGGLRRIIYVIPFTSISSNRTPLYSSKRWANSAKQAVLEHQRLQ